MTNIPHTGWGSRAKYEARLCSKCGSERLIVTDNAYFKCEHCGHLMTKKAVMRQRRVHP